MNAPNGSPLSYSAFKTLAREARKDGRGFAASRLAGLTVAPTRSHAFFDAAPFEGLYAAEGRDERTATLLAHLCANEARRTFRKLASV